MRVRAQISGTDLTLSDLRRLFRETGGWADDCPVEVIAGCPASITVIEDAKHRDVPFHPPEKDN